MIDEVWVDVGASAELSRNPCRKSASARRSSRSRFATANSARSPASATTSAGRSGEGRLDGDYVVCPWHDWKFHCQHRRGRARLRGGPRALACGEGRERPRARASERGARNAARLPHEPHPLARKPEREAGPVRVLGISTTVMTRTTRASRPRRSCSSSARARREGAGLRDAADRLRDLPFRTCEGYYSKSAARLHLAVLDHPDGSGGPARPGLRRRSCTGPTSSSSRRRSAGARPAALYYKMVERMNCIQNQITIAQPRPAAEQGGGVHHHRRPGQRAGGRRARCSASSPRSAATSRSSPTSPTRAAGAPRTWRTTSATCAIRRPCAKAPRRWSNAPSAWPA